MAEKKQNNKSKWVTRIIGWLSYQQMLDKMPFVLFAFLLAVVYIFNIHSSEGTIRSIDKLKAEMKEVRWEYMSEKSDLMFKCKQTEIAESVSELGLKEITAPPKKIVITKSEY